MEKIEIVFDKPEGKKHSVCYKTSQDQPAVSSIYVMRKDLGQPIPAKIKVTIEEVK